MTAPFGIEFYTPVESLEIIRDFGQGKFSVVPPKVHPSFETYIVQATPSIGIFWIKGISATLLNDAYGTQAQQLRNNLQAQLEKRYGRGAVTDSLMYGSIWNEPRYWTQGLSANERHSFVLWEKSKTNQLPSDIDQIFLGVSGFGSDETSVCIEYASQKMKEAEKELQDSLSDLL